MPAALSKLKTRPEFLAVAGSGLYCARTSLVLQVLPHGDSSRIGIGFTATRKVGNAVVRNRAKRRLRSLATEMIALHATASHDYVLVARAETTVARTFADLRRDLESALRRLKCWRDEVS